MSHAGLIFRICVNGRELLIFNIILFQGIGAIGSALDSKSVMEIHPKVDGSIPSFLKLIYLYKLMHFDVYFVFTSARMAVKLYSLHSEMFILYN